MVDININTNDKQDIEFYAILKGFMSYDIDLDHIFKISEAYKLAKDAHQSCFRKSGEPYITHPLAVAKLAVEYKADYVTVCTSLLHDVVEDTSYSLEKIEEKFGKDIAINVDGVTKITNMDYDLKKSELNIKTICKLFKIMIYKDVRTVAVKLFDRLHNMRTMNFMSEEKQIAKSKETLKVYVPLAEALGANQLKKELQDLSFLYLEREKYDEISKQIAETTKQHIDTISDMKEDLHAKLEDEDIENDIKLRIKNIYNVYVSLSKGRDMDNIHDLFALQIGLNRIPDCYLAFGVIHQNYPTYLQEKFKDYIFKCKTTGYRALHTTIVDKDQQMIQAQIRTKDMAWKNTRGIIGNLKDYNLTEFANIKKQYPFFSICEEIDKVTNNNDFDFYDKLSYEILGDKIYVTSEKSGKCIQLPFGATVLDYAFDACSNRAKRAVQGVVNGKKVSLDYKLKNGDRVTFTSDEENTIDESWINECATTHGKRLIKENLKRS